MARNSFIQISKLPNLKGRIDYNTTLLTIHFGTSLQSVIVYNLRKVVLLVNALKDEN